MSISLRPLLLCILSLLLAGPAAGEPASYRVGVEEVDYLPIYSAVPPERHYRGYARDLLDLFASSEGLQLDYVVLPVRRLGHAFRAGEVDLAFPDNPRWGGSHKPSGIRYSQPVLHFQDAMLVLPARLGQPRESFRRLGFIRGFTPWKFREAIASGRVSIHEAPNPEGLIHMLLTGRIDAANMARQVAFYHLRQQGRPQALVVEPGLLPISDSSYHLSSIHHPELIQRFDAFLQREAVAVQGLKDKYGL